jgi:hypothetical protein
MTEAATLFSLSLAATLLIPILLAVILIAIILKPIIRLIFKIFKATPGSAPSTYTDSSKKSSKNWAERYKQIKRDAAAARIDRGWKS